MIWGQVVDNPVQNRWTTCRSRRNRRSGRSHPIVASLWETRRDGVGPLTAIPACLFLWTVENHRERGGRRGFSTAVPVRPSHEFHRVRMTGAEDSTAADSR